MSLTKKFAAIALGSTLFVSSFAGAASASTSNYTVKKGDTLYKIALQNKTTYQNIMKLNGLSSSIIYPGQALKVAGTVQASTTATTSGQKMVSVARKYLGVKYTYGGTTPSGGFDCSGFVTYVLNEAGKKTARKTAAGFYSAAKKVSTPQVGDLVFYSGTYKQGVSHVGIYIGNNQMISAAGNSVRIDNIYSSYWKKYFTGFGRM